MQKSSKFRSSSREKHSLTWKAILILGIVLFSVWKLYPTVQYFTLSNEQRATMDPGKLQNLREKIINLGLDLQGGIHLVMEVDTAGLQDGDVNDAVDRAMTVISNRVDQFGLVEPIVQKVGSNRIVIELPGMDDVERAKDLIGRTAQLEFRLLRNEQDMQYIIERIDQVLGNGSTPETETAPEGLLGEMPTDIRTRPFSGLLSYQQTPNTSPNFDILVSRDNIPRVNALLENPEIKEVLAEARAEIFWGEYIPGVNYRYLYILNSRIEMTGDMIRNARAVVNTDIGGGRYKVDVEMTSEGVPIWANVTGANIGRRLAIALDGTVFSAPTVQGKLYGTSTITGNFNHQEATDLAIVLKAGALPASVNIIEDRTVGPSLGADSVRQSKIALGIGLTLVIAFMLFYYVGAGLIAIFVLLLNMLLVFSYLAIFRATLTLPGIAGIILTIGMAIDANVLIFERIREEIRNGNTPRLAVSNGFAKSRWTILDANITTFLTGIILYNFGTGPIRGFALTLMVGLVTSVFTALFVSRFIFDILTHKIKLSGLSMGFLSFFRNANFKFLKIRKFAYAFSGVVILAGMVSLIAHGGPKLSIDFMGGSMLELHFDQQVTIAEVRDALGQIDIVGIDLTSSEIKFVGDTRKDVLIRFPVAGDMDETSNLVKAGLSTTMEEKLPENMQDWIRREERVGPTIGAELKSKAIWSIVLSLIVLVAYITMRFDFKFSLAAILALVHDTVITIGLFSIFAKEISLPIIAAILTIIGYSLNDTIVIFDRIREKMRKGANQDGYLTTLDTAINQTLSRTVITSMTTFMTVMAMYLFGGTVINDFSFALIVGVIFGTYSTIFIATPFLADWYLKISMKKLKKA